MQRKSTIKNVTNNGVFTSYQEEGYIKRLAQFMNQNFIFSADNLTPKMLEQSPYKLHVSINSEDYAKHRDAIVNILLRFIDEDVIFDFKFTNESNLLAQLDPTKNLFDVISKYSAVINSNEEPSIDLINSLNTALSNYYIDASGERSDSEDDEKSLPDKDEIRNIIKETSSSISQIKRLLNGDQFTVYIPENYDKHKILLLCNEITSYLINNNSRPGQISDVESRIGKYINLRQELLIQDYDEINKSGKIDHRKVIESVSNNNAPENERRKNVILEQENSDLYQFLTKNIVKAPSLHDVSVFKHDSSKTTPDTNPAIDSKKFNK